MFSNLSFISTTNHLIRLIYKNLFAQHIIKFIYNFSKHCCTTEIVYIKEYIYFVSFKAYIAVQFKYSIIQLSINDFQSIN